MEENQDREQYFFEEDTIQWLGELVSRTPRVAGIFTPSLLRFDNIWVFDADERFAGSARYTQIDLTRNAPDLRAFGMVVVDPPFALRAKVLGKLLDAARGRPVLISATEWCIACAGWGAVFRANRMAQVTTYFPRYRSIANGYCESGIKRDGRTNISFYSNISFAPPRRPAILRRDGKWTTYDAYDFLPRQSADHLPCDAIDDPAPRMAPALVKAVEIERHWQTMEEFHLPGWRRRLRRWMRRAR